MEPPSELYITFIWLLISLVFCALFSFLETSLTALRLFRIKEISQFINKYQHLFDTLEKNPNYILIAMLIAYNLANVIAAILSSMVMEKISRLLNLSESIGFTLGIFITTLTILIVDLIPKNLAITHGDKLFPSTLWMINIIYSSLKPIVMVLSKFIDYINSFFYSEVINNKNEISEKEIQFLVDYINENNLMDNHKISMIKSIFDIGIKSIKDIVIPKNEIVSINVNSDQSSILEIFSKYKFTRMPVWQDDDENIIGIIHQKDFLRILSKNDKDWSIKDIIRPIIFIPESAKVLRILKEFKDTRMHMAIVLNEFGSVTGLVTLEDIIEEIVGEISDEYEDVKDKIIRLNSGAILANGSVELSKLEPILNIRFNSEDAITLGGFLIEQFGYLPKENEEIDYSGYKFKITKSNIKKIERVLVYSDGSLLDYNYIDKFDNL